MSNLSQLSGRAKRASLTGQEVEGEQEREMSRGEECELAKRRECAPDTVKNAGKEEQGREKADGWRLSSLLLLLPTTLCSLCQGRASSLCQGRASSAV